MFVYCYLNVSTTNKHKKRCLTIKHLHVTSKLRVKYYKVIVSLVITLYKQTQVIHLLNES